MVCRPGVLYSVGRGLYVSLTNRCNTRGIIATRGPGFAFGGEFAWLEAGREPSPAHVLRGLREARDDPGLYPSWDGRTVVFAGGGEPLLRTAAVLETCAGLLSLSGSGGSERGAPCDVRLNTNGLFPTATADSLKGSVGKVTVAVNAHDNEAYLRVMEPCEASVRDCVAANSRRAEGRQPPQDALGTVHAFVVRCRELGMDVEITCVDRPGVDTGAVRAFAQETGCSFRAREYFP